MQRSLTVRLLCVALLLATSTPLIAAEASPATLQEAKLRAVALIEEGKVTAGYDLLKPLHEANPADIQMAFLLGQAAMLMGYPVEAAGIFEKILARSPELPRVRAELGRAYAAMGKLEKAREQFQRVLSKSPPPVVGDNIRKFMTALETQKNWNARISAGYLHDSNVNAGPAASSVLMFGVPFQLSPDSKGVSDHAYQLNASAGYLWQIDGKLALQSDIQLSQMRYANLAQYDSDILSFSTGPTFQLARNIVSVPFVYEQMTIGHEAYSHSLGLAPQLRIPLTQVWSVTTSLVGQSKHYYVNAGIRDGSVWTATAGTRYNLGENSFMQATFRHGEESTQRAYLDNRSSGINFGFYSELAKGLSLYVSPGISHTAYAEQEAAFDARRRDRQYSLVLNVSKELGSPGLAIALAINYTRNDSNLTMYDYERRQVSVQLSQAF